MFENTYTSIIYWIFIYAFSPISQSLKLNHKYLQLNMYIEMLCFIPMFFFVYSYLNYLLDYLSGKWLIQ